MLHSQIILTMTWYAPFKTPSNEKHSEQNIKYPKYSHFSYAYIVCNGLKLIKTPQLDHLTTTKFPIYPHIKLKPAWSLFCVFFWCPCFLTKKKLSHTNPHQKSENIRPNDIQPLLRPPLPTTEDLRSSRGAKWALRL